MAIGAVHAEQKHLLDHFQADAGLRQYQNDASTRGVSSEAFYRKAIGVLASEPSNLTPGISVQILILVSIYASHRPSDNEQWHIVGMAMRIAIELGLHRHNKAWKFTVDELELRRRVFWTTYAIEITVAFNLGRPASISFQDADAPFPQNSQETALSIHHIKHRQIQEQMLCLIYRSRSHNAVAISGLDNSISNIESLQQSLDEWHAELHELYRQSSSPYPVEYWDRLYYSTSAALSRPTTLVPRPGPALQKRCFLSSYQVIEIHETLIQNFRLPYSWMLLQGLVFSAISMIVTTRTNTTALSREFGADRFIDILTRGVRNFHVVLAVMRERWTGLAIRHLEELLDKSSGHPGLLSENPPPSCPNARGVEPGATSGMSNGQRPPNEEQSPRGLLSEGAYQEPNIQFQPAVDSGLSEFYPGEDWWAADNLFEPEELRTFFDFPNRTIRNMMDAG
ncbi:fungal-specific transcription factor domain-containing protein [Aspergillus pseudodeflectus]|uniref:Fungal-specific transcription factor domain-containing protein n=1 Tax=Aspergillus pseudodeflectus TaxID=176178 RepID=A0ABR4KMS6_9EURO